MGNIKTEEPFYVRNALCEDLPLVQHLFDTISNANLEMPQES